MWNIITDSSCDWLPENYEDFRFEKIPFIMNIEDRQYLDTPDLDVDEMLRAKRSRNRAMSLPLRFPRNCPEAITVPVLPGIWCWQKNLTRRSMLSIPSVQARP